MRIQVAKVREFKGHTQAIYTLCTASDPNSFYSAGADGMVVKWSVNAEDGELFVKFGYPIYSIFYKDGLLFCGGNNGTLTIVDCETKKILKTCIDHSSGIFDIRFHNSYFLLAYANGFLSAIDQEYRIFYDRPISKKSLRKIVAEKDEIYIAGSEGIIWKLDGELNPVSQKSAENLSIFALAFNQKKKILLSGGRNATLKLWQNFEVIRSINAHLLHINDIAFNESQQYFATCSMDKTIKLWDADNYALLKVIDFEKFNAHQSSVNKILWIGINRFISCSDDRTIMCFDILE